MAAAAAGAIGFGPAGGDCGNGAAALAPPPGGGDGEAVTGWIGAVSDDGFADFPAGASHVSHYLLQAIACPASSRLKAPRASHSAAVIMGLQA